MESASAQEKAGEHNAGKRSQRYVAFLLRLWREGPERPWRASLQQTLSDRPQPFASLRDLVAFLERLPAEHVTTDRITYGGSEMTIGSNMKTGDGSAVAAGAAGSAIRQIVQRMEDGWNSGDAPATVADYAGDAVHVVWNGRRVEGPEELIHGHRHIFDNVYHEREMEMEVTHIHLLRPDVAVVECTARVAWQDGEQRGERRKAETRPLMVVTEEDGHWQIRAFHNTMVQDF